MKKFGSFFNIIIVLSNTAILGLHDANFGFQYTCSNEYQKEINTDINNSHKELELQYASYFPMKDQYSVGAKIKFRCPGGLYMKKEKERHSEWSLQKSQEIECQNEGTWSHSWPFCQAQLCITPVLKNGNFTIIEPENRKILSVNTKIKYVCNYGYHVDGVETNICSMYGSWADTLPDCLSMHVFKNRCMTKGKKLHIDVENNLVAKLSCVTETIEDKTQLNTLTIITSCAAAIFGLLLLVVAIVTFQRRRILTRLRQAHLQYEEEDAFQTEINSFQPLFQFKLPSYDEAVRSKPDFAPPTFDESVQADSMTNSQDASREEAEASSVQVTNDVVVLQANESQNNIAVSALTNCNNENHLRISFSSDDQNDYATDQTQLLLR